MMRKRRGLIEVATVALVAAIAVSAGLAVSGCGQKTVTDETVPGTAPGTNPSATATVTVFLLKGEAVQSVSRTVPVADAQVALTQMLKGPTDAEKAQGFKTAIPTGTRLLSYRVEGGKATVDFSSELKDYGGGSATVQAIVDQITKTVTANGGGVTSVTITIAGVPAEESLQP